MSYSLRTVLHVVGQNVGHKIGAITVTLGGEYCETQKLTAQPTVQVTTPAGTGKLPPPLVLDVAGQRCTYNIFHIQYMPNAITVETQNQTNFLVRGHTFGAAQDRISIYPHSTSVQVSNVDMSTKHSVNTFTAHGKLESISV